MPRKTNNKSENKASSMKLKRVKPITENVTSSSFIKLRRIARVPKVNEVMYPEENSNVINNKSSSNKKTVTSIEVTLPSENNVCSFDVGLMFFYIMAVVLFFNTANVKSQNMIQYTNFTKNDSFIFLNFKK